MNKRVIFIISIIVAVIALSTGVPGLLLNDAECHNWKLGLEIASLVSISVEIAFNITINVNINKTIKNEIHKEKIQIQKEYDFKFKDYSTKLSVMMEKYSFVVNNYYNSTSQKTDLNKNAMCALDEIFQPLEELLSNGFSCDIPFDIGVFDAFESFAADMGNTKYFFASTQLNDLFLELCSSSQRLFVSLQVTFGESHIPGKAISLYSKYIAELNKGSGKIDQSMINSAKNSLVSFNESFIDTINKYRELKRVWMQM